EELDKISDDVEQLFGNKLVLSKRVYYQAEQGFNSTMPLNNDELMIPFNMNSSPCASSFPFISSELTSNDGILYGINRHNNSLILFDRFSLQNANMVVFATSGAGKSVTGDTEVLVREREGRVRLSPIGPLVESFGRERGFAPIDEELEGVARPGIEVFAFDRQLRGRWSPVTVAARKIAPDALYEFRTQGGRRVRVTGDHNMLVLRRGQVVAAKSTEVTVGECIPVPSMLPEPAQPTATLDLLTLLTGLPGVHVDRTHGATRLRSRLRTPKASLPEQLLVTPELARLLGYIVSEGHVGARCVLVTNRDQEVLADVQRCLDAIGIRWFQRRDGTVVVSARVFIALIGALGAGGLAGAKRVPPFLFNCSNTIVAEFLRAYFEGDGGVESHAVTACSKSQALLSDFAYLLTRFGITVRLAERTKQATNSGARGRYGVLTVSGQEDIGRFAEAVGFVTERKRRALSGLLGKRGNTNVDTIPIADVLREVTEMFPPLVRGMQQVTDVRNGAFQPSRAVVCSLADALEARLSEFERLRTVLAPLAELPNVAEVVQAGATDHRVNAQLWSTLGHSWQTMRSGAVAPRTATMLRALPAIGGNRWTMEELKRTIAIGFRVLDLEAKQFAPWLSYALHGRVHTNTDYAMLQRAASAVWNRYEELRQRLPEARERIARLRTLATAHMRWDPVVAVKRIPHTRERYVYDLTVDDEVFLAGHGGLFVHNSYAVKLQVARSLMFGVDVIVIDPEMEYKHLSDAVGGTYINVSLASEAKINPFDLPRPAGGEEFSAEDIIRSAVITAKGLLKLMIGPFTTEEDATIDRALLETYAKKDITPSTDLSKLTVKD
ncbi:hypothetical protein HY634_02815, partial [Candidatus Uhrbacteria bacterium]|nr:hypothetical protein [Candidatus Uhrbacteria bacterium]